MGKVYIRVQTKTAQNPYPMGRLIYMAYIRESPPPPPPTAHKKWGFTFSILFLKNSFHFKKRVYQFCKRRLSCFKFPRLATFIRYVTIKFVDVRALPDFCASRRICMNSACFYLLLSPIQEKQQHLVLSLKDWIGWLRIKSNFQLIWSLLKPRWYVCTCQWHVIQFVKSNSLKRILCGLKKMYVVSRFFIGKTPVGILRNEKAMTKGM